MNLKKIFSFILLIVSSATFVACGGSSGGSDSDGVGYPESLAGKIMSFDAANEFIFDSGNGLTGTRNGFACSGTYEYKDGVLNMVYEGNFSGQTKLAKLRCTGTISGYSTDTNAGTYSCRETDYATQAPTSNPPLSAFVLKDNF